MAKEQPRFLAVLPWLQLAEEIEVGPFTFWRWPEDLEEHIRSDLADLEVVKKSVDKYFAHFKWIVDSWELRPLESFTVCSPKDSPWVLKDHADVLSKAVEILRVCSFFQTEIYRNPLPSRSALPQVYKNYGDFFWEGIPIGSELMVRNIRRRFGEQSEGGVLHPIVKPVVCTNDTIKVEDSLKPSLGRLLTVASDKLIERVFRALEWFSQAFTDLFEISFYTEIIMLTTAFEILLNPNYRGADKSKELCFRLMELFRGNRKINRKGKLRGGKEFEAPWKAWWLYWFYGLRNDIVHGEEIDPGRFKWNYNPYAGLQSEVAIKVFRLSLVKVLAEGNLYVETELDMFQADILDDFLSNEKYQFFPGKNSLEFSSWKLDKNFQD